VICLVKLDHNPLAITDTADSIVKFD
jgi:hypothetical protein